MAEAGPDPAPEVQKKLNRFRELIGKIIKNEQISYPLFRSYFQLTGTNAKCVCYTAFENADKALEAIEPLYKHSQQKLLISPKRFRKFMSAGESVVIASSSEAKMQLFLKEMDQNNKAYAAMARSMLSQSGECAVFWIWLISYDEIWSYQSAYVLRTGKQTAEELYIDAVNSLGGDEKAEHFMESFASYYPQLKTQKQREFFFQCFKQQCDECEKPASDTVKLLKCGRCKLTYYCSRECQKASWKKGHKDICKYRFFVADTLARLSDT